MGLGFAKADAAERQVVLLCDRLKSFPIVIVGGALHSVRDLGVEVPEQGDSPFGLPHCGIDVRPEFGTLVDWCLIDWSIAGDQADCDAVLPGFQ